MRSSRSSSNCCALSRPPRLALAFSSWRALRNSPGEGRLLTYSTAPERLSRRYRWKDWDMPLIEVLTPSVEGRRARGRAACRDSRPRLTAGMEAHEVATPPTASPARRTAGMEAHEVAAASYWACARRAPPLASSRRGASWAAGRHRAAPPWVAWVAAFQSSPPPAPPSPNKTKSGGGDGGVCGVRGVSRARAIADMRDDMWLPMLAALSLYRRHGVAAGCGRGETSVLEPGCEPMMEELSHGVVG
mmetsp:Transcript_38815/g.123356  ORF Transcript_38815/g.123356 Transcript_38815/m.123356 type:complete len:246 (-) Transcript_38815:508-1245(-)